LMPHLICVTLVCNEHHTC